MTHPAPRPSVGDLVSWVDHEGRKNYGILIDLYDCELDDFYLARKAMIVTESGKHIVLEARSVMLEVKASDVIKATSNRLTL